jgi:hypothetical protein
MSNPLILYKHNQKRHLVFDKERPFCKVLSFEYDLPAAELNEHALQIHWHIIYNDGRTKTNAFGPVGFLNDKVTMINDTLDLRGAAEIELELLLYTPNKEYEAAFNHPIKVHYDLIDKLDTSIPTAGFDEHLADSRNVKILFSAPFGQGKSTFLDYYFAERAPKYNVIKLFPINYSVAKNEDVFKYIKADILLQLLENPDVEFEKLTQGYGVTFKKFFLKNPHKILAPFVMLIPQVGKVGYNIYEKLDALKVAYFKEHNKEQGDDAKKALTFIEELVEEEGGIYENNFYSQLIRNLLVQLKEREPGKENVLLIDDLDRMDPDHIFRILNVLSAHYDSFHQNTTAENNKFGFDRIILVGDRDNIQNIYEYRYGPKVDFSGYMNKYFSTAPFKFDNSKVYKKLIESIDGINDAYRKGKHHLHFEVLANGLCKLGLLSLRELFKLQTITLKKKRELFFENNKISYYFRNATFSAGIALLSELDSPQNLISKVERLTADNLEIRPGEQSEWAIFLLIGLGVGFPKGRLEVIFKEKIYGFDVDVDDYMLCTFKNYDVSSIKDKDSIEQPLDIKFEDFKELLIKNIERYDSIKHLL